MSRIFISYKRVDKDKVFEIKNQIESALGETCWIDLDGIESNDAFIEKIITAIDSSEVFLFMYSRHHAEIRDYKKDWTVRELQYAEKEGKRVVFVNIDDSELSKWFKFMYGTIQQVDGTSKAALKRLIEDLQKWLPKSGNNVARDGYDGPEDEKVQRKDKKIVVQNSTVVAVHKYWAWVVFIVHCLLICFVLLLAVPKYYFRFMAAVALLGTYGAWMGIKKRRRALLVMSVGDLLTPTPFLLKGDQAMFFFFLFIIAVCLIINWLVLHVNVFKSKD